VPSTITFPVVGIGASAGGLPALLQFFENMPQHTGMAFVVILHLSPKHKSSADHVLQRATRMPVVQVLATRCTSSPTTCT
jgi:two-component system CheB/CheR fusion protein